MSRLSANGLIRIQSHQEWRVMIRLMMMMMKSQTKRWKKVKSEIVFMFLLQSCYPYVCKHYLNECLRDEKMNFSKLKSYGTTTANFCIFFNCSTSLAYWCLTQGLEKCGNRQRVNEIADWLLQIKDMDLYLSD